jgi:glucosylceramidase
MKRFCHPGLAWLVLGLIGPASSQLHAGPTVTITTPSAPWTEQPMPEGAASAVAGAKDVTVALDPTKTFQKMDGFGGCFNELGWAALNCLSPDARRGVLKELFDPSGANFTFCRMPVGANDYALSWYSLDDTPGDYELQHFSIARDEVFLIPYIRAAMEFQPGLRIWGSPWSPPAWLKTSGTYNGGSLKPDDQTLSTYAAYLSRYVKEYRRRGVNVVAVHVQNEPTVSSVYPSCPMDPPLLIKFIGQYLGPRFARDKPGAAIWLGTMNTDLSFVTQILDDKTASSFIAGAGFQWHGQVAIEGVHQRYPSLPLMQTENECGNGSDNWADAAHTWGLIHHYIAHGAGSYIYWNMILDSNGSSTWDWRQNAMISISRHEQKVQYNPEFYVMKHLSAFVKHDAVMIGTNESPDALAFRNPDGSIIVAAGNFSGGAENVHLTLNGKSYGVALPDSSVMTATIPGS